MEQVALALFAGAMLSVLFLGSGLAIGLKLGRSTGANLYIAAPRSEPPGDRTDMERMLAAWVELRLHMLELAARVQEMQAMPQGLLSQWQGELGRLTENLAQTLEQKLRTAEPTVKEKVQCLPASPEEIGHAKLISNEQILELLSQLGKCGDDSAPLVRYPYSAKQLLAHALADEPLPAEAFSMVQCHDLSVRDIRYFQDDPPMAGSVVIGLGLPTPVKWVAAEVEESHTAYRYGRVGYLVTARLLASIDNRRRAAEPQSAGCG